MSDDPRPTRPEMPTDRNPDVWDFLRVIRADNPHTKERIDMIETLEEPERTEKANQVLDAVWTYVARNEEFAPRTENVIRFRDQLD